jgi:Na+-driven multidrug efflux pump
MAADMGDDSMAAHQVAMNLMSISFSFGDGLQTAAVALIGKSLGEKLFDRAKEYGRACQRLGLIISIALSIILMIIANPLMTIFFPTKAHIVDIGVSIVRLQIVIVLFQVSAVVYMGCLRGAGDNVYTATLSAVSVTVIRTVVSYLGAYTFGLGIFGVWLGILADMVTRFFAGAIRFKQEKWVKIKI